MTQVFTQFISNLIDESILETSDDDILGNLNTKGYPKIEDIAQAKSNISLLIAKSRSNRLQSTKQDFLNWKKSKDQSVKHKVKSIDEMVADIVAAMTSKPDNVPEGLLIAFRDQDENTSDEDIESLWSDLVTLDLITPKDTQ
jgi:hypothetical protein